MRRGKVTVVVGAQWGDEGKGKVVDHIAETAQAVVRWGGGANAGHTVVADKETHALHLLPSGIVRSTVLNVVGPGVAFDPEVATHELAIAKTAGSGVLIDERAPIVLPIHRAIDAASERSAGGSAIGTTKRGIGPLYSDFWGRHELPLSELRSRDPSIAMALTKRSSFGRLQALARHFKVDKDPQLLKDLGISIDPLNPFETAKWLGGFRDAILPHLGKARIAVDTELANGHHVLFESAQGVLLDPMAGSRPYTTSSLCGLAGVSAWFGIYEFDRVIGVAKAYATCVGPRPFPTELNDATGELIRKRGHEFGTTTNRPRRCGWQDLPALQHGVRFGGIRELVVNKIDILTGIESLPICTDYTHRSGCPELEWQPEGATAEYTIMEGWTQDLTACRSRHDLPAEALRYLQYIESSVGVPITGVGVGPERRQLLWVPTR